MERARRAQLDVLCLGELLLELHADGPLEGATGYGARPGGAAAHVAFELVRAGRRAGLVGAVGDDPVGRGLRAMLAASGLDVRGIALTAGRTDLAFTGSPSGPPPRFVGYRGLTTSPSPRTLAIPASRLLHVASLPAPGAEADFAVEIAERARSAGAAITLDLNARPRLWRGRSGEGLAMLARFAPLAFVKASDEDMAALRLDEDDLATLAPEMPIILTEGSRGARLFLGGGEMHATGPGPELADAVAAGDAFCATILDLLALSPGDPRVRPATFWVGAIERAHAAIAVRAAGGSLPQGPRRSERPPSF